MDALALPSWASPAVLVIASRHLVLLHGGILDAAGSLKAMRAMLHAAGYTTPSGPGGAWRLMEKKP